MTDTARLPKAELHCHIEGAAPPGLVRRIAARNGIALPASLFTADDRYAWHDFNSFLAAYDQASACLSRPSDYRELVHGYLGACAGEGALYVEFFSSPDHAAAVGMSYIEHLAGLVQGIEDAERDFGILARIIVVCLRHLGPERAVDVARAAAGTPHPYVVGFGMAGDELQYEAAEFRPAFRIADAAGLGCTAHAGEVGGPESVRAAIDQLPVSRIGHGVRASEDPALLRDLARRGIVLEVCPGSNLALGLYADATAHPLRQLIEAGCRVTLNSDDPAYFDTSIGAEYATVARDFGLDRAALQAITRTALEAAFIDSETRQRLLVRSAAGLAYQTTP